MHRFKENAGAGGNICQTSIKDMQVVVNDDMTSLCSQQKYT